MLIELRCARLAFSCLVTDRSRTSAEERAFFHGVNSLNDGIGNPDWIDGETKVAEAPADHGDELRLWLRMLTCSRLVETEVRRRLRDEFNFTLPRFDLLAQLERAEEGMVLGEVSKRMMVSAGNLTALVERLVESGFHQPHHLAIRPSRPDHRADGLRATRLSRNGRPARRLDRRHVQGFVSARPRHADERDGRAQEFDPRCTRGKSLTHGRRIAAELRNVRFGALHVPGMRGTLIPKTVRLRRSAPPSCPATQAASQACRARYPTCARQSFREKLRQSKKPFKLEILFD